MWQNLVGAGRALLRGLVGLIYPPVCALCGQVPGEPDSAFCENCAAQLTSDPHQTCPRCAATVGLHALVENRCLVCRNVSFAFSGAHRLGTYDGVRRDLILRMKHHSGELLAELAGRLWATRDADKFKSLHFDMIVPVPLHWLRRLKRGYNQSEALADGLSQSLSIPLVTSCLRRSRATPRQSHLPPAERKTSVRGAFRARSPSLLRGRTVLLVDDVLTTGATLHDAARALREGGAARVIVAVLARAGIA